MLKVLHLFHFYPSRYGNKNGQQNRLKIEKSSFWKKFKALRGTFSRIRLQHS